MARAGRGEDPARLHGATASAKEIARLRAPHPRDERRDARRPRRAWTRSGSTSCPRPPCWSTSSSGASGASELMACSWALREGSSSSWRAGRPGRRSGDATRAGARSRALAAKFAGENAHGRQVARLALALFDAAGEGARAPPQRARAPRVRRAAARHRARDRPRPPPPAHGLPHPQRGAARLRAGGDRGHRAGRHAAIASRSRRRRARAGSALSPAAPSRGARARGDPARRRRSRPHALRRGEDARRR